MGGDRTRASSVPLRTATEGCRRATSYWWSGQDARAALAALFPSQLLRLGPCQSDSWAHEFLEGVSYALAGGSYTRVTITHTLGHVLGWPASARLGRPPDGQRCESTNRSMWGRAGRPRNPRTRSHSRPLVLSHRIICATAPVRRRPRSPMRVAEQGGQCFVGRRHDDPVHVIRHERGNSPTVAPAPARLLVPSGPSRGASRRRRKRSAGDHCPGV